MRIKHVYVVFEHPEVEGPHHDYYRIRILPADAEFETTAPYYQIPNEGLGPVELNASQLPISPTAVGWYDIYVSTATEDDTESPYAMSGSVFFGEMLYTDTATTSKAQITKLLEDNLPLAIKDTVPYEELVFASPVETTGITNTSIHVTCDSETIKWDREIRYNRITAEKFFTLRTDQIIVPTGNTFQDLINAINTTCGTSLVIGVDCPSVNFPTPNATFKSIDLDMSGSLVYCGTFTFYYSNTEPA